MDNTVAAPQPGAGVDEVASGFDQPNSGPKRILIVDDDPVVRLVYMNNFKEAGFEVESAPDGAAAWTKIEKRCPDAILLDLILPKGSGVELLKKVRAQPGSLEHLPVFVFTNAFLSEMSEEASRSGANQVFDKAVTPPRDIVASVQKGLGLESTPSPDASASQEPAREGATALVGESSPKAESPAARYFVFQMPQKIAAARKELLAFLQMPSGAEQLGRLLELYHKVHAMTGSAASAGLNLVAQQCATLEALLKELHEKPVQVTSSSRRTVSQAIDVLALIFEQAAEAEHRCQSGPFQALVANDDPLCRMVMAKALEQVRFKVVQVGDTEAALNWLREARPDVLIVDFTKSDRSRADLSSAIRALPERAETPVVHVAPAKEFEKEFHALPSAHDDLIARPFIFMELAVKAMVHCMRARLGAPPASRELPVAAAPEIQPEPAASPEPAPESAAVSEAPAAPLRLSMEPPTEPAQPAMGSPAVPAEAAAPTAPTTFGIITLDQEGKIESLNPTAASLFGYLPMELTGLSIETLVPTGWPSGTGPTPPLGEATSEAKGSWIIGRRKDGSQFPANVVLKKIVVGKYERITAVVRSLDQWLGAGQRRAQYDLEQRLQRAELQLAEAQAELDKALAAHAETEERAAALQSAATAAPASGAPSAAVNEEAWRSQVEALTSELAQLRASLEKETSLRAQAEQLANDFSEVAADFEKRLAQQESGPAPAETTSPEQAERLAQMEQELARVREELQQTLTRREYLEQQLDLLSSTNTRMQEQIMQPQETVMALQRSNEELARRIESVTGELVQTRADLNRANAQRDQMGQEAAALQEAASALQQNQLEQQRLQAQLAALTRDAGDLTTANAALKEQLAQAQQGAQTAARLEQQVQSLAADLARNRTETEQNQQQQQQLREKLNGLAREAELLRLDNAELARTNCALQEQAQSATQGRGELEQKLESMAAESARQRSELEQSQTQQKQLWDELDALTREADGLKKTNAELAQANTAFASRMSDSEKLSEARAELERECRSLSESLARNKGELEQNLRQQQQTRDELATRAREAESLQQANTELLQTNATLQERLTQLEAITRTEADLGQKLQTLAGELAQSQSELEQARQQREQVQTEAGELARQNAGLNDQLAQRDQSAAALAEQRATLERQLHETQADLGQKLQTLAGELAQSQSELEQARQQREQVQAEAGELARQHAGLSDQLAQRDQSAAALVEQRATLERQLHETQAALAKAVADAQEQMTASAKSEGVTEELLSAKAHLEEETARRRQLEDRLADVSASHDQLVKDLAESQEAATALRKEQEALRTSFDQNAVALAQTEARLHSLLTDHEQSSFARVRTEELEQGLAEATRRLTAAEKDLARRRDAERALLLANQTLQARFDEQGRMLARAAADVQAAQAEAQRAALQQKSASELRRQRDEWEQLFQQSQQALDRANERVKKELTQREILEKALQEVRTHLHSVLQSASGDIAQFLTELQSAAARREEAETVLAKAHEEVRLAARRTTQMAEEFRTKLATPLHAVVAALRTNAASEAEGGAANSPATDPSGGTPANVITVTPAPSASTDHEPVASACPAD
ncbi:MAG: response regulator [Verrucomicrobia bacterium]|nr:response regulator [Verrucomicrobiota bacterium]